MPVSHKRIIKMSVKGFLKQLNDTIIIFSIMVKEQKKGIIIKITAPPNVYIHCLLDTVVTCV